MVGRKRKPVLLLAVVALSAGVLGVGALQPPRSASESTKAASQTSPEQSSQSESQTGPLFAKDSDFASKPNYGIGRQELFVRTMLAVVFVMVLGGAAIYVSRRLLPKLANRPGKEIRIVETIHLGPRRAVHLIEVGHRRFLIGSTNENIRKLAEVTADFPEVSEQDLGLGSERT